MSVETILAVPLSDRFAIKKIFGKSDDDIASDIHMFKEWLIKQPHLPQNEGDQVLELVLRRNKFSLEKAKTKFDCFFSIRNVIPEFYDDRDMFSPKMQFHLDNVMLVPLPKLTDDHSRIVIFSYLNNNPDNFDINTHAKYVFIGSDLRYYYDTCINDIVILDLKNCTLAHALKHTPAILQKLATIIQNAYSDRIKGVHFLNLPHYANILVNLTNAVLKDKISARVNNHKDLESLHKCVPRSLLPAEYGGTEKSVFEINADWRKTLEDKNDWIRKIGETRSNEKLRIGTSFDTDIFGSLHGTFRQLNVD